MCGIIGYIGEQQCTPILVDGLRRLEYRGYDSAGVAVVSQNGDFQLRRAAGKLANLEQQLRLEPIEGHVGVGHTRWATHGRPTEVNAHPHRAGDIVVVHNGIVENHLELKRELAAQGHEFISETDSEIIAHLVLHHKRAQPEGDLAQWVQRSLLKLQGSYAVVVVDASAPDTLVAAKNASPLVLGLGEGENFVASDIPAILSYTRRVVFLEEGQAATVRRDAVQVWDIESGAEQPLHDETVSWSPAMAEKGGYKHFMLKEIHEQPRAIADTLRGRVSLERNRIELDGVQLGAEELAGLSRITIVACGTSWHAGLVGEYLIEALARIQVEVELASEYRYRDPIVDERTLVIAISQSGETADTLAALRMARSHGARVLGICNVVGSSIARESDDVLYTHAGPEIGVASTKAFTTQLAALALLAIHMGQQTGNLAEDRVRALLAELMHVPTALEEHLQRSEGLYAELAREYAHAQSVLYLGRGLHFPIALEGALKLKEISYIHAEGYAAGEMKHGPIALLDEDTPSVFLIPRDRHYDKALNNLAEIRARNGRVLAVATEGDEDIREFADHVIYVPALSEWLQPLVTTVPMQLVAYTVADLKGTDVDQPRNLAKSVTVE